MPPKRTYDGFAPVVGVDVDGVLGQYHSHFLRFAAAWLGRDEDAYWPGPKALREQRTQMGERLPFGHYDYDGTHPLCEYMGITKATYRKVKLYYRQSGLKRSMPVYPGAADMMKALRAKGCWVVVCTTRPYLHLSNIEPDTLEFLQRNKIPFDDLIMGEHKYRTLRRRYGNVAAVVDDDPALLSQAAALSVPSMLMRRGHNFQVEHPWWAGSCSAAQEMLISYIKADTWMLGIQPKNEEFA